MLLAEDDALLGDGLRAGLRQRGFEVDWVRDGLAAELELRAGAYAAAVLDLGLPLRDSLQVLANVREAGLRTPVLVLTARDAVPDRVKGLDTGADDGPGMARGDLEGVGERFFRVSNAGASGSGLEWSIAHRIAEVHGGSIAARNRLRLLEAGQIAIPSAASWHHGRQTSRCRFCTSWAVLIDSGSPNSRGEALLSTRRQPWRHSVPP